CSAHYCDCTRIDALKRVIEDCVFFFQAEDGIRDRNVTGVQTCALPISKGLRVAAVYGGAPLSAQAKRARDAHILVATPGRLQDLVERRLVSLDRVRALVLDEADRMLDMGFKPQVDRLVRRLPRERQTMLFSATLD